MTTLLLSFPQLEHAKRYKQAVCGANAAIRWCLMGVLLLAMIQTKAAAAQDIVDVLSKNCFVCHGPNVKPPMGGLAFSGSDALKKGGKRGPAVVPWKSAERLLFKAVSRTGELKMPPAAPLSNEEVEIIRKRIDARAICQT